MTARAAAASHRVPIGDTGVVTALAYDAEAGAPGSTLILAHGAGADQRPRFMTTMAASIAARGVRVITFNFLYTEQRRRSPDRAPLLEKTWRAVAAFVCDRLAPGGPVVIGGKSMGGRMASHVAAAPSAEPWRDRLAGLVLLGYPLHPPGKPAQLRTAHLPAIRVPILLVQGTRDAFGTRQEVEPVFRALPAAVELEFVEGGDHSFAVPKSSGRTESEVLGGIAGCVAAWVHARRL